MGSTAQIKNMLRHEAVETEVSWLENDTVEGISPSLAKIIIADRRAPKSPAEHLIDFQTDFQFVVDITVDSSEIDKVKCYIRSIGSIVSETISPKNKDTLEYNVYFYASKDICQDDNYFAPAAKITNDLVTGIGLTGYANYKIGIKVLEKTMFRNQAVAYPPAMFLEEQVC